MIQALMNVRCSTCGARVPAEELNEARGVAQCRDCQQVFSFDPSEAGKNVAVDAAPAWASVAEVAMPSGITIHRDAPLPPAAVDYRTAQTGHRRLRIVRRWFLLRHLVALVSAVVWNAFMVVWVAGALSSDHPVLAVLASLIHVAAGLWLTYIALTGIFNRTVVVVDRGVLSIRSGPIPAAGNRDVSIADLRQLFVVEQGARDARTYELQGIVRNGPIVIIAKGMTNLQQARFLERVIEEHIGIIDERTPGELPK